MSGPLRVLHLLDTDQMAGTEKHVLLLMAELAALGVSPILACRADSPVYRQALEEGLPTLPLFRKSRPLHGLRRLDQALHQHSIDLVHAHNGRMMLAAALLSRRGKTRAVATQHFLAPQFLSYGGLKRRIATQAHHWVNKQIAHFLAVSEAARQAMIEREQILEDKITTVVNGVQAPAVPGPERRAALQRELGIAPDSPLCVTVARLSEEKGLLHLIAAAPLVLKTCPNARFVIVGEGPLRPDLEQEIAAAGLSAAVILAGFRPDATDIIAAGDLFVLPSLAEPFGLVLLEAMALGKPVVATAAGGPLEIVVDGKTGLLVPPADARSMADALRRLLTDTAQSQRLGCAGQERFQQHFQARTMAAATLTVYQHVQAGRDRA